MKTFNRKLGFTLLELTLVAGFFSLIFVVGISYYRSVQLRVDFDEHIEKLVADIRRVRSNVIAGASGRETAVHLQSDGYVLFSGLEYDPADSLNLREEFPATFTIENIVLEGGGSDIFFSGLGGGTDQSGSFDFVANQLDRQKTISISGEGVINY